MDSPGLRFRNTGKPWSNDESAALLRYRRDSSCDTYERLEPVFGRTSQALRLQIHKLLRAAAQARRREARRDSLINHESDLSRGATPETPRRKSPTIRINPRKAWAAINSPPAVAPARPPIRLDLRLKRFRTQVRSQPPIWLDLRLARFRKATAPRSDENQAPPQPTKLQTRADAKLAKASDALFECFDDPEEESEPVETL